MIRVERKPKKGKKKIRTGDKVVAIAGNYRGQSGTVLEIAGNRVRVQGLNMRKKHVRKSQENPQGGILEIEGTIHISNVMPTVDGEKPVKLKVKQEKDQEKSLVYRDGKKEVEFRSLKKHNPKS